MSSLPASPVLDGTEAVPVLPSTAILSPLPIRSVQLNGGFWGDLQELNRDAIIPHGIDWVTRLGWLRNLEKAASPGVRYEHRGREFADSEIYKLIEAMSWERARAASSSDLDDVLERFIERVGFAGCMTDSRQPGPSLFVTVCGRRDAVMPPSQSTRSISASPSPRQ